MQVLDFMVTSKLPFGFSHSAESRKGARGGGACMGLEEKYQKKYVARVIREKLHGSTKLPSGLSQNRGWGGGGQGGREHALACLVSMGVACSSMAPSTRPTVCVMNWVLAAWRSCSSQLMSTILHPSFSKNCIRSSNTSGLRFEL